MKNQQKFDNVLLNCLENLRIIWLNLTTSEEKEPITELQNMKNSILLFVALIILLAADIAGGFDVDGLRDGMKKDVVVEILSHWRFEKVLDKGDQIHYSDLDKEYNRYYVVTFKNNKLVGYSKNFKPSIANYISIFKLLSEEYGTTVKCTSTSDMIPAGELKYLRCTWVSPLDEVTVGYSILPFADELTVSYMAR
ncbi:MAG: hypothetical protein L7F78_16335 [Syntrophales bacterium LBB04]|nr:hypothetical protein [Syntrophales bacterium LBB04]